MKKVILSLATLFMASTAMADSYFYMDDISVAYNQLGKTITVPVKAHFDGRVNGFQVDVNYPEGMTPTSAAPGSSLTLSYMGQAGESQSATPYFGYNDDVTRFMAIYTSAGYWYPNGGDSLESYGAVKIEAGDYDNMFTISLQVARDFTGGEITINSNLASGVDTRGGTVNETSSNTVNVMVEPAPDPDTQNYFVIGDTEVLHGETVVIPVEMINADNITAFQADLYLPEGFSFVTDENNMPMITPTSRLTSDHEFMTNIMNDGAVRIISYSTDLDIYKGHEGAMFTISVQAPDDNYGEFNVELRNCRMTTDSFAELNNQDAIGVINVLPYILGDANDSHTVTVTDVVWVAQHILGLNPEPFIFGAADVNKNDEITITDAVLIANMVLNPGWAPAPTTRAAAPRLNNDAMSSQGANLTVGQTARVTINLDNEIDYTAFQFDLHLPDGLSASNFMLTDRAGNHTLDVNMLDNGMMRVLCYSPQLNGINDNEGALLTFEVTASGPITSDILVDGIEMVSTECQTVILDAFTIGVNSATTVNELATSKTIEKVEYYNLSGQQIEKPESGVTIAVTTYTDGSRTSAKVVL